MDLSPKERNILLLLDMRGGSVDARQVLDMADNESRAEIAAETGDIEATFKASTIDLDPERTERKREEYAAALASLLDRGALHRDGDRHSANAGLLESVAVETIAINLGLEKSHPAVAEARAEQLLNRKSHKSGATQG